MGRLSRLKGADRAALAADLAKNYTAGTPIRGLMERTGRSYGTVYRLLTESGVELRPPAGPRKTTTSSPTARTSPTTSPSATRRAPPSATSSNAPDVPTAPSTSC